MNKKWISVGIAAVIAIIGIAGVAAKLKNRAFQKQHLEEVIKKYENTDTVAATEEPVFEKYTVITDGEAILRDTPSEDGQELAKITSGSIVEYMNENPGGFYKVRCLGSTITGYLPAYTLKSAFTYSLSDLTIVDADSANYTMDEFKGDLNELSQKYSSHMSYSSLGKTSAGNDIYEIIIGGKNAKKHVLLMSGIRGSEYMGSLLLMKQAEYYLEYYDKGVFDNIKYSDVFDNIAFHVIPIVNPDGVLISQKGIDGLSDQEDVKRLNEIYSNDRLSSHGSNIKGTYFKEWGANYAGVDLYHNFDRTEISPSAVSSPSYIDYAGDADTPETRIIKSLLDKYSFAGSMCYYATGSDIVLKYDKAIASSQKSAQMALAVGNLTVYDINSDPDSSITAGGFTNWSTFHKGIPGIIIRIGDSPAPLPLKDLQMIWLKNRENWIALASVFLDNPSKN